MLGVVTVVHPGVGEFVVDRDSPESVAAANRVAAFVRDHTKPSDEVLALWGQPATLASGRDLVPSATFGLFSYEDLSDDEARDAALREPGPPGPTSSSRAGRR